MRESECPWPASWSLNATCLPSGENDGILAKGTSPEFVMAAPVRVSKSLACRGPSMPGLLSDAAGNGKPAAVAGCAAVRSFEPSGYTALKPQSSSPGEFAASGGGSGAGEAATSNELLE